MLIGAVDKNIPAYRIFGPTLYHVFVPFLASAVQLYPWR